MVRGLLVLAVLVLTVGPAAAPAGASHTGLLFGASRRVVIALTEWKFEPAALTISAGESVDSVLQNAGTQSHVFMVYPAPTTPYKSANDWWTYVLERT